MLGYSAGDRGCSGCSKCVCVCVCVCVECVRKRIGRPALMRPHYINYGWQGDGRAEQQGGRRVSADEGIREGGREGGRGPESESASEASGRMGVANCLRGEEACVANCLVWRGLFGLLTAGPCWIDPGSVVLSSEELGL